MSVNAFRQPISESWQKVADAFSVYQNAQTQTNANALLRRIGEHFRSGIFTRSEVCPMLGMMHGLARAGRCRGWLVYPVVAALRLHPQLWNIAGWNDFEMAGWMVAHDRFYTARIYRRLYYARGIVQETCAWMVNSVKEQEPDFDAQWREINTGFPPHRRSL